MEYKIIGKDKKDKMNQKWKRSKNSFLKINYLAKLNFVQFTNIKIQF